MRELVDLLKILADESRLKLVYALQKKPACVCELCEFLGLTQPTISSHLKQLRQAGIVDYKKDGKWVEYFLVENKEIKNLLKQLTLFIKDSETFWNEVNSIVSIKRENIT